MDRSGLRGGMTRRQLLRMVGMSAGSAGAGSGVSITPQDAEAIGRECPSVRWSVPSVDGRAQLVYGNRNWGVQQIKGSTPDYLYVRNWMPMAEGAGTGAGAVRRPAPRIWWPASW